MICLALTHREWVQKDVAGLQKRDGRLVLHVKQTGCLFPIVCRILLLVSSTATDDLLLED